MLISLYMNYFTLFWQSNSVTVLLVLLVVISSIAGFFSRAYFDRLLLIPHQIFRKERLYTLATAPFIHKNVLHLVLNMVVLIIVGAGTEQDLSLAGRSPFFLLLFFLLCALLANLGSSWHHRHNMRIRSMGASGGALGLMAMHLLLNPFKYMLNHQLLGHYNGITVLAFLFVLTALGLSRKSDEMVDHWNHFYGVVGGTVLALVFFGKNTAGIFNYYF